ncbi:MAG: hypothetical protein WBZ37_27270 [Mycobacterium sp.]
MDRIRLLFPAFATAAAISGLLGSPVALADDDPPPPPPPPQPAPADVPQIPVTQGCVVRIWGCQYLPPMLPPPDARGTPDDGP